MKKILALLLVVVMVLGLVACGSKNETPSTGETGGNTSGDVATGTEGGTGAIQDTLTIGIASDINGLNPQRQNDQINNNCLALTHQPLVFLTNDTNEHVPNLAKSCEWVDDNHLVFELVENAVFSDGTPMTAEDVEFTFTMAIDPEQSNISGSLSLIEKVEAIGDYTVEFTTKNYSNELLSVLAGYPTVIQSKAAYESGMEEPWYIGTGRYVFSEGKEGQ